MTHSHSRRLCPLLVGETDFTAASFATAASPSPSLPPAYYPLDDDWNLCCARRGQREKRWRQLSECCQNH